MKNANYEAHSKANFAYVKTSINVCFQVLQYNVPGGKKNRGLSLVYAYRTLATKDELTPENIRLSQIMGWCVEMVREKYNSVINDTELAQYASEWFSAIAYSLSSHTYSVFCFTLFIPEDWQILILTLRILLATTLFPVCNTYSNTYKWM